MRVRVGFCHLILYTIYVDVGHAAFNPETQIEKIEKKDHAIDQTGCHKFFLFRKVSRLGPQFYEMCIISRNVNF